MNIPKDTSGDQPATEDVRVMALEKNIETLLEELQTNPVAELTKLVTHLEHILRVQQQSIQKLTDRVNTLCVVIEEGMSPPFLCPGCMTEFEDATGGVVDTRAELTAIDIEDLCTNILDGDHEEVEVSANKTNPSDSKVSGTDTSQVLHRQKGTPNRDLN